MKNVGNDVATGTEDAAISTEDDANVTNDWYDIDIDLPIEDMMNFIEVEGQQSHKQESQIFNPSLVIEEVVVHNKSPRIKK